jgi:hypothetical protein
MLEVLDLSGLVLNLLVKLLHCLNHVVLKNCRVLGHWGVLVTEVCHIVIHSL